ncbi:MAG TPA: Ig-like domain-containing protein [Thermoguttaceae bacterium]|nr:Ig-like domain-containing protein [Thermoguttaceae bacterium]
MEALEPRLLLSFYPGIPDDLLDGYEIYNSNGGVIQGDGAISSLVEEYAPVLKLHKDEHYHPKDVSIFAARDPIADEYAVLRDDDGNEVLASVADVNQLAAYSDPTQHGDYYLDLPGDSADELLNAYNQLSTYADTIYGTVAKDPKSDTLAVQFWFPYYVSDLGEHFISGNTHEGDWEGMTLFFDKEHHEPTEVFYNRHHDSDPLNGQTIPWDSIDVADEYPGSHSTHPVAYVALGSHATYYEAGWDIWEGHPVWDRHQGDGDWLYPLEAPERPADEPGGENFTLAVEVLPRDLSAELNDMNWLKFAGHWGQENFDPWSQPGWVLILSQNDGPRGPAFNAGWLDEWDPPSVENVGHGFGRDTDLWVRFSEPMDESTFTNDNITVVGSQSGQQPCSFAYDDTTYTVTIDRGILFDNGEMVTVSIGTAVTDLDANGLDGDGDGDVGPAYEFSFCINTDQQESIQRGIDWLLSRQYANGSWRNDPANTSMAVLAMLNAGYHESHPAVANGIDFILPYIRSDGSVGPQSSRYTYRTSIAILPLVATHNPDYHDEISKMRTWLVNSQWDESSYYGSVPTSHWYYGGFGYGDSSRPDLSNTQWALMGLKAADRELGLHAANSYSKATNYFLPRCQRPDGGSGYTPGSGSIHTMTAASVWSYNLCGVGADDWRVQAGLQWLDDRYSVTNNDGWGWWSEYYYKVTLAKALVMSHKTMLGEHDWFADLSARLMIEQQAAGNWPDTGQAGAEISTAWAILALQTRTLAPGADVTMSMILTSHADLHVYDPQGRHLGINYDTGTLEQEIPEANLKYYEDVNGDGVYQPEEERTPADYLAIPTTWDQTVELPQLVAGSYRTELVGTSDGPYELTIAGLQDDVTVTSNSWTGDIDMGERLATSTTVTSMEGTMTLLYESLTSLPTLAVTPDEYRVLVEAGSVEVVPFDVSETGGDSVLHSVSIYCTDFTGAWGTIPGSSVTFDVNHFDVDPGATQPVVAHIPVPAGFEGQLSGAIVVESSDGGTKSIDITLATNQLNTIDVQKGATQRSYVRYVDLIFENELGLADLITGDRVSLARYGLDGSGGTAVDVTGVLSAIDNRIEFDFGEQGIGGNRNSNVGDGYYEVSLDLDGNGSFETTRHFYRLLGDTNGDRVVDAVDIYSILHAYGSIGAGLEDDANGDGVVNALDRVLAMRAFGRALGAGLAIDD